MMYIFRGLIILACLASLTLQASTDAESLIRQIDELYRSDSSESTMTMTITTPHWQRSLSMQCWTIGMEHTFIRILAPKKERGVATLKKEQEIWNYFPKINKTIKVPPSMMMGSWMGSDFTNDDLVREASLLEDYHAEMEDLGDRYRLTLTPKTDTVTVWASIDLIVEKESLLPIEQRYFNEKGEKVRTLYFSDVQNFSGKALPATLTMVPHNKDGHKTVITYDSLIFEPDMDEQIFTLRNLQQRF